MERLQDALERLTPLLDQLPIGVQLIDGAMRYRYLNRVAAEHSKRRPAELLGRTMQECYPGIETTQLFQQIHETLAGGAPREMENVFEFPDGSEGWFELRMFKLYDGIAISSVDITRRKLLQLHHRHSQRMDATRQLAGGIAHDFNNLLTIVGAYTELVLNESNLSAAQRTDLGEVLAASNRATELTRRLLALSRHAKGEPQRFELEGYLRALVRTLGPTLGQSISLGLVVHGQLGEIEIDPTALEQVIASLALNAKDAMSGNGTLRVEARRLGIEAAGFVENLPTLDAGSYCEIAIIDHGPGIATEQLDRVFDPHLQNAERVGTGLGLAMCWSIVEQAGGTIHVESKLGVGSTFRIVLPQLERAVRQPEPVADMPAPRAVRRAKVLVVDDEAAIRQAIVRQLERAGHSVVEAADGADALEQLRRADFDLVISDVLMPVMGGVELARQLAERGCLIPGLLISGYSPEHTSAKSENQWPLLQKPFTNAMLLDAVAVLLRSGVH